MNNLKFIDFISPPITLYYKGEFKHTSNISILLSILSITTLLVLSVIYSLDFILHKNPTSYYYIRYIEDTGFFPLNSSSMFHFIAFGNSSVWDTSAFSVIGVGVSELGYIAIKDVEDFDFWIYDKCEGSVDAGNKINLLGNYSKYYTNALCIKKFYNSTSKTVISSNDKNFNYPILAHGASNVNEKFYGLFIQRCVPNKKEFFNVSECYSEEISDELILNAGTLNIFFIDQYVDVENYTSPLQHFYHQINNRVAPDSYTKNVLNFHAASVKTRTGLILENIQTQPSYIYDTNEKVVSEKTEENNNLNIYGAFYFSMQNMQNVYDRKYKMIQDISANITGMIRLILFVAEFLNYLFYRNKLYEDLSKDINENYKKVSNKLEKGNNIYQMILAYSPTLRSNANSVLNNNFIKNKNTNKNKNKNENENSSTNKYSPVSNLNLKKINTEIKNLNNNLKNTNNNQNEIYKNLNNLSNTSQNINNSVFNDFITENKKKKKKYNRCETFIFLISCWSSPKKNPIIKLFKLRERILSEEDIFNNHYIVNSLKKIITNKNFNLIYKNNNYNDNK